MPSVAPRRHPSDTDSPRRTVHSRTDHSRTDHSRTESRSIDFIPNDDFASMTEADFRTEQITLYEPEELPGGAFEPDTVAASLLSALRKSRLLTFEGEQYLFRRMNFLRYRADAIQSTLHPARPSRKKLRDVERLLHEAGDVREELAKANLRLVASIAGKLAMSREEFDEFVAEGNGILLYAIDKFDYSRGYRFSTYVTHAIQRHLYRVIRRRRKRSEKEVSREPELLVNETAAEPDPDEPTDAEISAAASAIIARLDETLDDRESFIVRSRFGLDGTGAGKTYRLLAEELGLSKERVRQLFQQSLEKLRRIAEPFESTFAPVP